VVCAHGGQSGIDMFNAACDGDASFAAVVTDLGMPQVDGRQVAAAVKVKARNTLVIMLTGWGQQLDDRGSQSHVDAILAKPPNMWELRDALARASLEPVMEALNPAA
jgi:DNA-binding response OmpR family regulator